MTNKKKRTQRICTVCLVLTAAAVLSAAALTKTKKENKTYA